MEPQQTSNGKKVHVFGIAENHPNLRRNDYMMEYLNNQEKGVPG